jgi:hypothetical protein
MFSSIQNWNWYMNWCRTSRKTMLLKQSSSCNILLVSHEANRHIIATCPCGRARSGRQDFLQGLRVQCFKYLTSGLYKRVHTWVARTADWSATRDFVKTHFLPLFHSIFKITAGKHCNGGHLQSAVSYFRLQKVTSFHQPIPLYSAKAVGTAMGWRPEKLRFDSRQGRIFFIYFTVSRPVLENLQAPSRWALGAPSSGGRWPGCEADHSPSPELRTRLVDLQHHSPIRFNCVVLNSLNTATSLCVLCSLLFV